MHIQRTARWLSLSIASLFFATAASGQDIIISIDSGGNGWLQGKDNLEVRIKQTSAGLADVIRASATTQEQLVQLLEAQLNPGRAPVITLPGTLGLFHVAQQRVHLRHS